MYYVVRFHQTVMVIFIKGYCKHINCCNSIFCGLICWRWCNLYGFTISIVTLFVHRLDADNCNTCLQQNKWFHSLLTGKSNVTVLDIGIVLSCSKPTITYKADVCISLHCCVAVIEPIVPSEDVHVEWVLINSSTVDQSSISLR